MDDLRESFWWHELVKLFIYFLSTGVPLIVHSYYPTWAVLMICGSSESPSEFPRMWILVACVSNYKAISMFGLVCLLFPGPACSFTCCSKVNI